MNASASNVPHGQQLNELSLNSYMHKQLQHLGLWLCAALLLLLLLSLTACAHQQPTPCEPLKPMPLPALSQQLPSQDYSISVEQSFKAWRQKLTDTSTTSN